MKVLVMLVVMNVFNIQESNIKYRVNNREQVVSYQVKHGEEIQNNINSFIELLNKYILKHGIKVMTEDDYIDMFNIF